MTMNSESLEICEDVMAERAKTGRDTREILEAMRDEGYILASDADIDECVAWIKARETR